MAMTTSKTVYSAGYAPLMPGVFMAPFPYAKQWSAHKADPVRFNEEWCAEEALHGVELVLKQQTAPKDTAAMIIEPVQGEGGYVAPPKRKYSFAFLLFPHTQYMISKLCDLIIKRHI